MDIANKHYYRAVIYYYTDNNYQQAAKECYQALANNPNHQGAIAFIKKMRPQSNLPSEISEKARVLLNLIDQQKIDEFLVYFLCEYDIDSFLGSRIDWLAVKEIKSSEKVADRIWTLILEQDWQRAYSYCENLLTIQGNPVTYFQIGYIFYKLKKIEDAEGYFFLLLKFSKLYAAGAMQMLLRLPKRTFKTLADYKDVLDLVFAKEKFIIARILQQSWDKKGLNQFLHKLYQNIDESLDYLSLAKIYLDEGDWRQTVRCLSKAKVDSNTVIIITNLMTEISFDPPKALEQFCSQLCSAQTNNELLTHLAQTLEVKYPKAALTAYKKLYKSTKDKEAMLGQVICLFYLENYKKAQQQLDSLAEQYPDWERLVEWRSRFRFLDNPGEALKDLEDIIVSSQPSLISVFEELSKRSCPNCISNTMDEVCRQCGYYSSEYFRWSNKLHWQGKQLAFPQSLILFTTDSLEYHTQDKVYFIIFSPIKIHAQLKCLCNEAVVWSKSLEVKGLASINEENFAPGVYHVVLQIEEERSLSHYFIVGQATSVSLTVDSCEWIGENALQTSLAIEDRWGFGIRNMHLTICDASGDIEEKYIENESKEHKHSIEWQITKRDFCYLKLETRAQGHVATVIVARDVSWSEICQQVFFNKDRINVTVDEKFVEFSFSENHREILIILQPLGNEAISTHRFYDTKTEETIRVNMPDFLVGFYCGATRFTADALVTKGIEYTGWLMKKFVDIEWKLPETLFYGEKFAVTITVPVPCYGYLIHKKTPGYLSLKKHLFSQLAGVDKEINSESNITNIFTNCPKTSFLAVEIKNTQTFYLQTKKKKGKEEIICILSNGKQIFEKSAQIQVLQREYIDCELPANVATDDTVEIPIRFYSEQLKLLKITTPEINKKISVSSYGEEIVNIYSPGDIEITLGNQKIAKRMTNVDSIHMQKSRLLGFEKEGSIRDSDKVYTSIYELIHDIINSMLAISYHNTEIITAKLYGLAVLYRLSLDKKVVYEGIDPETIENQILHWQKKLMTISEEFIGDLWGQWRDQKANVAITTEILHHLSPFLEMPKFKDLYSLAGQTLAVCKTKKIKNNRLLFLSRDFQEKIHSVESAAALLIQKVEIKKVVKYLQKTANEHEQGLFWKGNELGGDDKATALAAQALWESQSQLATKGVHFLVHRLTNGTLKTTSATVALIELLLTIGKHTSLPYANTWYRYDEKKTYSLLSMAKRADLKIKINGPEVIQRGDEFTILGKTNKVKYPKIHLFVPSHLVVFAPEPISGYVCLPFPEKQLDIECKAIYKGIGNFRIVVEDYYEKTLWKDNYTIVVV